MRRALETMERGAMTRKDQQRNKGRGSIRESNKGDEVSRERRERRVREKREEGEREREREICFVQQART